MSLASWLAPPATGSMWSLTTIAARDWTGFEPIQIADEESALTVDQGDVCEPLAIRRQRHRVGAGQSHKLLVVRKRHHGARHSRCRRRCCPDDTPDGDDDRNQRDCRQTDAHPACDAVRRGWVLSCRSLLELSRGQLSPQFLQLLSTFFDAHPERFVKGRPKPPDLPVAAWINPPPNNETLEIGSGATLESSDDLEGTPGLRHLQGSFRTPSRLLRDRRPARAVQN